LVLIQPSTCAPPENQSVLLASSAKCKWWVPKQVATSVNLLAFGSYMAAWRLADLVGNAFAEGWLEPCWQNGSVSAGR